MVKKLRLYWPIFYIISLAQSTANLRWNWIIDSTTPQSTEKVVEFAWEVGYDESTGNFVDVPLRFQLGVESNYIGRTQRPVMWWRHCQLVVTDP